MNRKRRAGFHEKASEEAIKSHLGENFVGGKRLLFGAV